MMIEQLAAQSFAAARRGDGDREDFRLARDEAGENERDDAVRDSGAMGNNVAIEQELLEFALAPASTKRRGMEHGKGTGVARSGFGKNRVATREQAADERDHRRGSCAADCGCASGARR